ncbi:hypothetical protein [Deinococcus altitudinis]|uniref:hypothetical protein n=1 Tax=Deinococcus altitudinis TaxID=468914 RepID=UPI0038917845
MSIDYVWNAFFLLMISSGCEENTGSGVLVNVVVSGVQIQNFSRPLFPLDSLLVSWAEQLSS